MVIAVAAAPGHLEIVRLAGLDAADAGAAAGNVQDHRRHLGAGQEAKPLLHQGDAGEEEEMNTQPPAAPAP